MDSAGFLEVSSPLVNTGFNLFFMGNYSKMYRKLLIFYFILIWKP